MWLPLSIALIGCDAPDPMIAQAEQYATAIRPLLSQSEAVERHFLDLAGEMTQNPLTADAVAAVIHDKVLPTSATLIEAVGTLDTSPPRLVVLSADLEDSWRERDAAWRAVLAAWDARDAEQLQLAVEARAEAREAEERYIFDVNAVLRPYGQRLQLYP